MAKNPKNVELQENEVDVAMSKTEKFLADKKNQKNILMAIVAVVLVVGAFMGVSQCNSSKNAEAQDQVWESELLFSQGQYEQAVEGFVSVADEYGSTKAGNMAKAYAGLCYKNMGNYEEAINYLADYSGNDNVVAPAILCALGNCLVNKEGATEADYKKAAETFEKAAKAANTAEYTPLYLKKAGIAYEAAGEKSSALKVYQAIKDNWAETVVAQTIDKYIERAQ